MKSLVGKKFKAGRCCRSAQTASGSWDGYARPIGEINKIHISENITTNTATRSFTLNHTQQNIQ